MDGLGSLFKQQDNILFRRYLDDTSWKDVRFVLTLSGIPSHERYEEFGWEDSHEDLIESLKEKYDSKGTCPNELYFSVSKNLKNEYDMIHCMIRSTLDTFFY
jgi:hypothetical protein